MSDAGAGDGALPRRRFGRLDVEVTALGMGCAALNECYGRDTDDAQAVATVRRALELGVRYFDTSPLYGESERRLGLGLAGWPRAEYFLATKTGTGVRPHDYSAAHTFRSVEQSLARLGTNYLDLVLIHDPDDFDPAFAPGGALEALEKLKAEGVIRGIGLGVRSHAFHRRAIRDGRFDAILTYLDYTLLDQSALSLLDEAHAAGVAVVLGAPLATGFLSDRPVAEVAADRSGRVEGDLLARAERMEEWARARGESRVRLALQFCLQEPHASVVIVGARSPDEVEAHVAAAQAPVNEETWRELADAGFPAGGLRLERRC